MFGFFIVLHVLICIALMVVVLMQSAKGEGLAGAFGGGGALSGAVFGGRGAATLLSRATTVLAVLFMLSCILLTFISKGRTTASSTVSESAVGKSATEQMQQQQMPATTPVGGQPAPAEGEQPPAGTGSEGIFDEESASEGEIPPPPEEGGN